MPCYVLHWQVEQGSIIITYTQSLSVRFNDHFPGEPGLAGIY